MNDLAIEAQGLSKLYHIGRIKAQNQNLQERLVQGVTAPFRRMSGLLRGQAAAAGDLDQTFWALRDVSFTIRQGERVAVVGSNGAGKSTLLKILARVTHPTTGSATIRGRIGSLLEVGTGFHWELTGRENVYLNGSILGMRHAEVRRKFDDIVAFAEVEQFIDTPVKHYSSGMRVRLAFSVAAHLEPEVLIVDEVLSVGDAPFRKKCMERIHQVAEHGTTILVVSHQAQTVTSICKRAIWLDKGRLVLDGPAHATISAYLGGGLGLSCERVWEGESAPGGQIARYRAIRLTADSGEPIQSVNVWQPCCIETEIEVLKPGYGIVMNHSLLTSDGTEAFSSTDTNNPVWVKQTWAPGTYVIRMRIPSDFLQIDTYTLETDLWVWEPEQIHQAYVPNALCFDVIERDDGITEAIRAYHPMTGAVRPRLDWQVEPAVHATRLEHRLPSAVRGRQS